jgi:6-pyruvoyltetrahydropterin/6-carboxytetrahydropterin synthase
MRYVSTKIIPMGSTAFRQWKAQSHCRLIHGYRLQCKLWFTTNSLDDNNWVYDFGGCKEIKNILEKQFDHTTCVAEDDPELETFKDLDNKSMIDLRIMKAVGIEKTAQWVFEKVNNYVRSTTNDRVEVIKVEVWEHEGNSAIYENDAKVYKTHYIPQEGLDYNIPPGLIEALPKNPEDPEQEELNLEGKKEEKEEQPQTPPLNLPKSTGISDPFAGTSWGNS